MVWNRDFFETIDTPAGPLLKKRIRDIREFGVGPELAAKLVLEMYFREG